ncbi:hypothetical protein [Photorhabdus tasmaniensis]|uniref:Uncharacterized protein n=1 Tax=Photorhabdus tasmaniensis TaxID=1004159 RepID=A0ABX0GKG0_9GAMM|nr:hypothetical protein [Photorhabdus tasmaniensis]NHB89022.1 hypothetical protein [Photorhabdus tasmaniensis]
MTREELIEQLTLLGVDESSYSLDGLQNNDCTCVVQKENMWCVCYVERDSPYMLASFTTKEDAYGFILEQFKKWLS